MRNRIHCTLVFHRRDLLHLSLWSEEHAHGVCFKVVKSDERAISIVHHIEDCLHISLSLIFTQLSAFKPRHHLFRRNLVEMERVLVHFLYAERLPNDMCEAYGGVVHEELYLLSEHLLSLTPHDWVFVHFQSRIYGVHHHRVANSLQVFSEHTHMRVGKDLSIDRVSLMVIGNQFHGVAMSIERIALRIVDCNSISCCHAIARVLVVVDIVSEEHGFIDGIVEDNAREALADSCLGVMV